MTNRAARLSSSSVPEARRAFVGSACVLAAAALWASPALAGQAPSEGPLGSPGVAPAPPSRGKAPAPSAQPSPPEASEKRRRIERATALHDEAQGLYQNGEYRAAIAKLQAAVDLDPEGKELVYNLAVIHERLGEIERAEHYYLRYLEMEALPKEREQVTAVLKRLQGAKRELAGGKAQVAAPPSAAPSAAPTAAPLPLLPRVRLLPHRSVVAGNPRPPTPWLLVSGGIAAGSLVVGSVFAALAVARDPGPDERTGGGVTIADLRADARAAHRCAVVADVALVIAGLSGAAALYLYLSPRAPASARAARSVSSARALAPSPGRDDAPPPRGAGAGEGAPAVSLSLGAEGAQLRVQF
ncbi:tetratricopeptide repeat protein [Sorangium sp. So ce1099]|uniref:tetratricopeptide repeat protein n=1 Tax=Sorangium sp. So ce1099 TaxID=3133331 RepID=UPI003F5FA291